MLIAISVLVVDRRIPTSRCRRRSLLNLRASLALFLARTGIRQTELIARAPTAAGFWVAFRRRQRSLISSAAMIMSLLAPPRR
jgi:hypothetical protein